MTNDETVKHLEELRDRSKRLKYSSGKFEYYDEAEQALDMAISHLSAYPPAHIDREAWMSVNERMPDEDQAVIVIANGKPRENIILDGAFELAEWSERDGWFLECWPDWENPVVTHWMPLPDPPEEEG